MSAPTREGVVGSDHHIGRGSRKRDTAGGMTADLRPEEEGPDEVRHRNLPINGVKLKRPHLKETELDEVDQIGHQA